MRKEETRIEGDRYLIYYWFDDEARIEQSSQTRPETEDKSTGVDTRSSTDEDAHLG
jgi:hypothetical protein